MIGGYFPNITSPDDFTITRPYFQDDLTWCIQKSKNVSWFISLFLAAAPECWVLMIFGVGYFSMLVIYIMIQFDLKYNHRNSRDIHYLTLSVVLTALIGTNQRFHPKWFPLRLFYGYLLLVMVFAWQTFFLLGWPHFKNPGHYAQITTVNEIIADGYRLAGSIEVHSMILHDQKVIKTYSLS